MRSHAPRSRAAFIAARRSHFRRFMDATNSICRWRSGHRSKAIHPEPAFPCSVLCTSIDHVDVRSVSRNGPAGPRVFIAKVGALYLCGWTERGQSRRARKEHDMTRLMLATVAGAALLAGASAASAQTVYGGAHR